MQAEFRTGFQPIEKLARSCNTTVEPRFIHCFACENPSTIHMPRDMK